MSSSEHDLRALVASVVKEMVGDLVAEAVRDTVRPATPSGPGPAPSTAASASSSVAGAELVAVREQGTRTETVRIADDVELNQFARRLLALFENPKSRQDLRTGRLSFRLTRAVGPTSGPATGPAVRIERGAVTERQVKAAAESGHRMILGRRAVLTPLGREKARAENVHIERER